MMNNNLDLDVCVEILIYRVSKISSNDMLTFSSKKLAIDAISVPFIGTPISA